MVAQRERKEQRIKLVTVEPEIEAASETKEAGEREAAAAAEKEFTSPVTKI